MEGANLSGDLENPGRDLGKGTIISVCASFTHYALLFTLAAFAFPHSTLVGRDTVFQDVEFWPGIAVIGISIVGFSAALGFVYWRSSVYANTSSEVGYSRP